MTLALAITIWLGIGSGARVGLPWEQYAIGGYVYTIGQQYPFEWVKPIEIPLPCCIVSTTEGGQSNG